MLEMNRLYNLDCMDGMKDIPDKFFDLAIVDPPYGLGIDGQKLSKSKQRSKSRNQYVTGQKLQQMMKHDTKLVVDLLA